MGIKLTKVRKMRTTKYLHSLKTNVSMKHIKLSTSSMRTSTVRVFFTTANTNLNYMRYISEFFKYSFQYIGSIYFPWRQVEIYFRYWQSRFWNIYQYNHSMKYCYNEMVRRCLSYRINLPRCPRLLATSLYRPRHRFL